MWTARYHGFIPNWKDLPIQRFQIRLSAFAKLLAIACGLKCVEMCCSGQGERLKRSSLSALLYAIPSVQSKRLHEPDVCTFVLSTRAPHQNRGCSHLSPAQEPNDVFDPAFYQNCGQFPHTLALPASMHSLCWLPYRRHDVAVIRSHIHIVPEGGARALS